MTNALYPSTSALVDHILTQWPEHRRFIEKSLAQRSEAELIVSNQLSSFILALSEHEEGGIERLCEDYKFLCEKIVLPEEIYFRRNGKYRLDRFEDANAECYANAEFMAKYMNGLLLSDVLWANHASAFAYFVNTYLPTLPINARHLEIGPGHGLFLHFAACHPGMKSVTGWDISPTSIDKTRHALDILRAPLQPELILQDMFDASGESQNSFESLTMSEILEHLEHPEAALKAAREQLVEGGSIFVNIPANSPAPDHIYLFNDLDHIADMVEVCGFEVTAKKDFPMSGATLEQAKKHKLSVSCVVVGRKI